LLDLVASVVDVTAELVSFLHGLVDLVDIVEVLDLLEAFLVDFELCVEFVLLLFELGKEDFLLVLNFSLTVLNDLADCHGPHLLEEGVLEIVDLVHHRVILEELVVLVGSFKLFTKFDLGHILRLSDELTDENQLFFVGGGRLDLLLHITESGINVVDGISAPLGDILDETVADLDCLLVQGLLDLLALNAEHGSVNKVVRKVLDLISSLVVLLDSVTDFLDVSFA